MTDSVAELNDDLAELSAAEDFLDYFEVEYDPRVVHVNRLHILQRFHDYLAQAAMPPTAAARRELYRGQLQRAYGDFTHSDAISQKVFKVFRMFGPQAEVRIPLSAIGKTAPAEPC